MNLDRHNKIVSKLDGLLSRDIRKSSLGTLGFRDAHECVHEVCVYLKELCGRIVANSDLINEKYLENQQEIIAISLVTIENYCNRFSDLEPGVSGFDVTKRDLTQELLASVRDFKTQIYPLEVALRLAHLEKTISANGLDVVIEEIVSANKNVMQIEDDSIKILKHLRKKLDSHTKYEARQNFGKLAESHKKRECISLTCFFASATVTMMVIFGTVAAGFQAQNYVELTQSTLRNALIIAPFLFATKIAYRQFSLERNLRLIYSHRNAVISQYEVIDRWFADSPEAKSQLRIEIAKAIFTDPQTGFAQGVDGGDVNINSVMSTVEKIAKPTG